MRTVIFPAKSEQLDAIREFVGQAARDADMDDAEVYAVQLSVDEACSNIIEYAYHQDKEGDIECTCDPHNDSLTIVLRDHGLPFDSSLVPSPDLSSDLKERRVGGLGVFLMHQLMDEIRFEPLGESGNVLTMIKRRRKVR
jgi:anti-sigma regulatory factor (Ser/Thr protein kinase)